MDNKSKNWQDYRPATRAVRAGQVRSAEQEHSEPIFTTSSFVFDSAEQAAARFAGDEKGNVYSRFSNPTISTFQQRLAEMEGAESCVATSSGMSAILSLCMASLSAGDHVISSSSIFGASKLLFTNILQRFGIEFDFVSLTDHDEWKNALKKNTKLVFFETPTNPLTEIGDIAKISELVHSYNADIKVVVDNCFCTPVLQQPLSLGADVVIHSATKYIDGQGRCIGGAIVGDNELVGDKVYGFLRTAGTTLSPFNAWVFLKGLETLDVRMRQASDNALILAQWLQQHEAIEKVYYPGLESHPQYHLAKTQQSQPGAIVSFDLKGGKKAAWDLINKTELISITANLGDTRTMITHPATTTHGRWTDDERLQAGIGDQLIRIAVGLEDIDDIKEDLQL